MVPLTGEYGWSRRIKGGVTAEVAVAVADVGSLDENVTARNSLGDFEGSLVGGQVVGDVDFDAVNDGDVNRDRHGNRLLDEAVQM